MGKAVLGFQNVKDLDTNKVRFSFDVVLRCFEQICWSIGKDPTSARSIGASLYHAESVFQLQT